MLSLLAAVILAADAPAVRKPFLIAPPVPTLTGPQQTALDCGVAFGLVGAAQAAKRPGTEGWPVIGQRHREFFVRVSAQIMDAYGIGREQMTTLFETSRQRLTSDPSTLRAAMPGCLALFDAAKL